MSDLLHKRKMELVQKAEDYFRQKQAEELRKLGCIYALPEAFMEFYCSSLYSLYEKGDGLYFNTTLSFPEVLKVMDGVDLLPFSQVSMQFQSIAVPDSEVKKCLVMTLPNGDVVARSGTKVTPLEGKGYIEILGRHLPGRNIGLPSPNRVRFIGWIQLLDAPVKIHVLLNDDPILLTAKDSNGKLEWSWKYQGAEEKMFPMVFSPPAEIPRENERMFAFTKARGMAKEKAEND